MKILTGSSIRTPVASAATVRRADTVVGTHRFATGLPASMVPDRLREKLQRGETIDTAELDVLKSLDDAA